MYAYLCYIWTIYLCNYIIMQFNCYWLLLVFYFRLEDLMNAHFDNQ